METPVLSVADFVRWTGYVVSRVNHPQSRHTSETIEVLHGKLDLLGGIGESARPEINGTELADLTAAIDQLDAATKTLIAEKYSG